MNKLTVSNPLKEALKQLDGLDSIGGRGGDWRYRGFCWSCCKDKPRAGGKVFGAVGRSNHGVQRFKCADCVEKSKAAV